MINWLLEVFTAVLPAFLVLGLLRKPLAFRFPSLPQVQRDMRLLNY